MEIEKNKAMKKEENISKSEKFAVIKISGVQLKVYEGKEYEVNKLSGNKGDKIEVTDVLMVADGDDVKIGKPTVDGAKVDLEITSQKKGEKIKGFVYKSKSRYRRRFGFRASLTRVKVVKIS